MMSSSSLTNASSGASSRSSVDPAVVRKQAELVILKADQNSDHMLTKAEVKKLVQTPGFEFLDSVSTHFEHFDVDHSSSLNLDEMSNLLMFLVNQLHPAEEAMEPTSSNNVSQSTVKLPSVSNATKKPVTPPQAEPTLTASQARTDKMLQAVDRVMSVADVNEDQKLSLSEVLLFLSKPERAFLSDLQTEFKTYDKDWSRDLNMSELLDLMLHVVE
eukprot:CAMPEP_0194479638 /NCGR_PEP_ID=MMETSP0253-20130528/2690_1 /TAXON_ID=2966 /ORGANISM="Noctiluca scintillans" /LENGTH=215 /DNA_ID=CAMNT_0039318893 /DNA_START=135 /DNA_END=782 /DNA_ORIENTATION=+